MLAVHRPWAIRVPEGGPVWARRHTYTRRAVSLGRNLQQLARLIKSDAGVEAAFAEVDGWDHHQNENQQLFTIC